MSLKDELTQEITQITTVEWVEQWRTKLSPSDRKTWDAWLSDPTKHAAAIFRVIRRHGYPHGESSWRHWVKEFRRGAQG